MTSQLTASVDAVLAVLVPLVDDVPTAEDVDAGWWYLVVFGALVVAVYLLWRSMRRQIKKIDFDDEPAAPGTRAAPRQDG